MNGDDIVVVVVVASLTLLVMAALLFIVLISAANRRHRHRAEIAEMGMQRDQELRKVEQEAISLAMADVGRELHDNVGQLLTVAQLGFWDHLDPVAVEHPRVRTALEALDQGVEEVRRLGRTLNHDNWRQRELLDAVGQEAVRLERLGMANVHVLVHEHPADPAPDVKTILFRAFQEVISNALRHSAARTILITVGDRQGFKLSVSDDGEGFDMNHVGSGSGLVNIRHRCGLIGYEAVLSTAPGAGCRWTFQTLNDHAA